MIAVHLIIFGSFVIATDQLSKMIVNWQLAEGQFVTVGPLFRLRRVTNSRASTGVMRSRLWWLLLWGLTFLSLVFLLQYGPFFQGQAAQVALGVALGGATSNLLDRLKCGAVIDFIDLGFWPVFNFADVAIVFGVAVAFWYIR